MTNVARPAVVTNAAAVVLAPHGRARAAVNNAAEPARARFLFGAALVVVLAAATTSRLRNC